VNTAMRDASNLATLFCFLGVFAKLRKLTVSFIMYEYVCVSVYPHGTPRFPLDGFL